MRISMILGLCAAAACASAQSVNMVAVRDGKPAGSGTFSLAPGANHSFTQSSTIKLLVQDQQYEFSEVVKIGSDGATLSTVSKASVGGKLQKSESIAYNAKEAIVTNLVTGEKTHYPIPGQSKVKDPAELWFISIRPHVGDTSKATSFDESTSAWQTTTRTYVRDVAVNVNGAKAMGHELKDEQSGQTIISVVDDHGLPYEFEVEGIKFTRK